MIRTVPASDPAYVRSSGPTPSAAAVSTGRASEVYETTTMYDFGVERHGR
jgi:hypothetical protein